MADFESVVVGAVAGTFAAPIVAVGLFWVGRSLLSSTIDHFFQRKAADLNAEHAKELENARQDFQRMLEEKKNEWAKEADGQRAALMKEVEAFKAEVGFRAEVRRMAAAAQFAALMTILTTTRDLVRRLSTVRPTDPTDPVTSETWQMVTTTVTTITDHAHLFEAAFVDKVQALVQEATRAHGRLNENWNVEDYRLLEGSFFKLVDLVRGEIGIVARQ